MQDMKTLRSALATVLGIGGAVAVGCSVCCLPLVAPLLLSVLASAGIYRYADLPAIWPIGLAGVAALLSIAFWSIRRWRRRPRSVPTVADCACKTSCKP